MGGATRRDDNRRPLLLEGTARLRQNRNSAGLASTRVEVYASPAAGASQLVALAHQVGGSIELAATVASRSLAWKAIHVPPGFLTH